MASLSRPPTTGIPMRKLILWNHPVGSKMKIRSRNFAPNWISNATWRCGIGQNSTTRVSGCSGKRREAIGYANSRFLERLLPVIDNFELGLSAARLNAGDSAVLDGMSMVQKQLEEFLREQGIQQIDAVGQKFDPNLHEALGEEVAPEVPEGHVVRQLRKGYKLRDRLLRAANVFVSKAG